MREVILVALLLSLYDYLKPPIDLLYFQKPLRLLIGMRNTLIDILLHKSEYDSTHYPGLWYINANYNKILNEYEQGLPVANKKYFHDLDRWFEKNEGYYYYDVKDFPVIQNIIDAVPCVDKKTAKLAVIEGPISIAPHRAESNLLLRYHLTLKGGDDCILHTSNGMHRHEPGTGFLFDHSRLHSLVKRDHHVRVVLILDIHRFN